MFETEDYSIVKKNKKTEESHEVHTITLNILFAALLL